MTIQLDRPTDRSATAATDPATTTTATAGAAGAAPAGGRLTLAHGTALYVGAVLGTGVIFLPSLAASTAGPASLIAWLGLVIVSAPVAHMFAALGARHPDAGGVATYARLGLGRRAEAVVGWCFFLAVPVGAPAGALFAGAYVAETTGGGRHTAVVTAAVLLIVVTVINWYGVVASGKVQLALASLLACLLLVVVLAALPESKMDNLQPWAPHGWLAIGPAAAMLMWSFAGWEAITHLAAEFRHPARDLPRAAGAAVVVVGTLYLAVAIATVAVLGPAAATTGAPLAGLLAAGLGGPARLIAAGAALLLTLGTMNAYIASAAKLAAALGRDGALPGWLARGAQPGRTPRRGLAVVAGLATLALAVVAIGGIDATPLVLLTSGSLATVYAVGAIAGLRLLPRGGWARRSAWFALGASAALLALTGWYLLGPLLVGSGALLYLRRHRAVRPMGAGGSPLAVRVPRASQWWVGNWREHQR